MTYQGHWVCGRVSFTVEGAPRWCVYCHCASCRRHTASPVSCFVNFRRIEVAFEELPDTFQSSPGVTRSFCGACGTPIAYETEERPGEIDLYLNVFDDPEDFEPSRHVFCSERISWFDTRDELPRKP